MNTTTVIIILIGGAVVVFGGFFATVALLQFFLNKSRTARDPQLPQSTQPEPGTVNQRAETAPEPVFRAWFGFKQILPVLIITGFSLVSTLVFMPLLSAEPAFRFNSAGEPASFAGASLIIVASILVQLLFVGTAWFIGKGIKNFINRLDMPQSSGLQAQKVISVAANMIALPQLIAAYISFDIFIYDVYNRHLIPVWIFAIITMVIGGIFLCVRFYNIMRSKSQ
ncbi:MAG: hypothetical protein PHQ10_01010 [Dehalococcoidales bacterium]|jgi:hypothetical protein|nr:hypothetical protein [Dehalococcoidales bacterium]MDD3264317.1 hypothetical protein [Dehalococcoidales bacterium]MDD4322062.1 hypothetical protein [Dehalococcoidales bacterium]MDD5122008.1 hypothetical protein [Dehalococcoidales bacterium]MDD5497884.1 hypothetical protein [Dehalococcoidales bacterium]